MTVANRFQVASEARMPIALGRDGQPLRVADSNNGLSADAVCLCCGHPVVAKQGSINQWHFAHQGDLPSGTRLSSIRQGELPAVPLCTQETWLHRAGKALLRESIAESIENKVALALTFENDCYHKSHFVTNMIPREADSVDMESQLQGIRPDLAVRARGRVLMLLEVIVTHKPEPAVYEYGVPVLEFWLTDESDLRMVDASIGNGLQASRIANQTLSKRCKDNRRPCRSCGAPVKGRFVLCYKCALHPCENCGTETTSKGTFCSVDCKAEASGWAICSCGAWHSGNYESCYGCSGYT